MFSFILIIIIAIAIIILLLAWRLGSRRWSLPCPVWMKWLLDPPSLGRISGRTKKTIRFLDPAPGMQVLDAGCGPGRLTIPMAGVVGPDGGVTAMDLQEGMLSIVRKRAAKENLVNIRFILGGIGEGRLQESYFDRIILITVLGEIPDREGALEELYQALKPEGILLIEETIRDPHFQTADTVRRLAGDRGFVERGFMGNRFSYRMLLEKPPES